MFAIHSGTLLKVIISNVLPRVAAVPGKTESFSRVHPQSGISLRIACSMPPKRKEGHPPLIGDRVIVWVRVIV